MPPSEPILKNAGELMAWARTTFSLARMDVLNILEVEGFEAVPDMAEAKGQIHTYMEMERKKSND